MLRRLLIIISLLVLTASASVSLSAEPKNQLRGPIIVTSETLTADNKAHTALFEKNVIAKTADMTLYADRMLVYYTGEGGEVTKIEASGNVKLYKDSRLITSRDAVYYADEEKIIFKGSPRAVNGDNVVTGSKMTFFIRDDRSVVDNSRVFLKNKRVEK